MVAKRMAFPSSNIRSLNLAKIHMVAKLSNSETRIYICLNLAKIHMVAKQSIVLRLKLYVS